MIVDDFCLPPKKGPAIPTSPRRGLFFVPRILSQLQPRPPQGGVFFRGSENGGRRLSRSTLPGSPAPRLSGGPEDVKPRNFAGRNERAGVTPPRFPARHVACLWHRSSFARTSNRLSELRRVRIRAIVGVFCACRYLSFVAICREFELSTNSDRTAMCGGSRAPIHQGTMVWQ